MTTQAPDRTRTRRGLPTWATVIIAMLVALGVGVVAVIGLVVWAMSGGWDGIRPKAHADDRRVVKAREASVGEMDAFTAAAVRAIGPSTETARVRVDLCLPGQNNWKVHDGYTLSCQRRDAVVLDAGADLAEVARRADATLTADGWQPAVGRLTSPDEQRIDLRGARYERPDRPGEAIEVGLATTAPAPFGAELQYLSEGAQVDGDLDAFVRAAEEPRPRVVVVTTAHYFQD